MSVKESLTFFERRFPSANMVLVRGRRPLLIDSGYGSDYRETELLIGQAAVEPSRLAAVVNTHYHSDHVGGNHGFQRDYGLPVYAHSWDQELVRSRHPATACAEWLDQPIEPYGVDRGLRDGDEIDSGGTVLRVLHLPGHTQGHIGLYDAETRTLIAGDLFHSQDVGWLNRFQEGLASLSQSLESLDRLAKLPIDRVFSGHGPAIHVPLAAMAQARRRYQSWLDEPEKEAWHACKRIFAYALILHDGLPLEGIQDYLLAQGWFQDFSRSVFRTEPEAFVSPLLESMSRGVERRDGRLYPRVPYTAAPAGWRAEAGWPRAWPSLTVSQSQEPAG